MALKKRVKSLDEVPEAYHSEYKADGDEFVLDLEGDNDAARLKEFRTNNISLTQKIQQYEQQMAKLKDIDPEEYAEAKEALKVLKAQRQKKLIDEGELETVLQERTAEMRRNYETQLAATQAARKTAEDKAASLSSKLSTVLLSSEVTKTISALGALRPGAIHDVHNRAKADWTVSDEGVLVPKDHLINGTGDKITTMEMYAKHLFATAPYLFEAPAGGGAPGGKHTLPGKPGSPRIIANGSRLTEKDQNDIMSGAAILQDQ